MSPNRFRRTLSTVLALAVVVLAAVTAQGQAAAEGPARWERAALTVHVADPGAWAGTDVAAALAQWSPAMGLTLTDDADADIVLASAASRAIEGATAHRSGVGSVIDSCRVDIASGWAGSDATAMLTHELGHCLGLSHNNMGQSSIMYWLEGGEHFSESVTDADLDAVRGLYR